MTISFADDAGDSLIHVLSTLAGWTVRIEYHSGVTGFPVHACILYADALDITISDVDEGGRPVTNSQYHVGYDEINFITVL